MKHATRFAALLFLVLTGACSSDSSSPTDPSEPAGLLLTVQENVVVLTQNVVPTTSMEALFEGTVDVDDSGCLRLATEDAHTVIWPVGYGVVGDGGDRIVLDENGDSIGTIGDDFALSGGEVTELSDALGFDADDRSLADSRCSGRYWIVG